MCPPSRQQSPLRSTCSEMRHLLSYTVYDRDGALGEDMRATLDSIGADGLELLTSYDHPDPCFRGVTESVHLPYATDWMAAWEGRPYDMDDESARFYMFGRSREDVVSNVADAIRYASELDPAYGVFHAGDGPLDGLMVRDTGLDSRRVLDEMAEMMNTVVASLPGGEPPFRILFENLWWPGLRLLDDSDFGRLESRLEFERWGICVDTGHMMNCLPDIYTEQDGIAALEGIFSRYCDELIDRVVTVHFHWSASYPYRRDYVEKRPGDDIISYISEAFGHISRIDQHMPFSDPRCNRLLEILRPEYVTHEMPGSKAGMLEDFRQQRSLLP